MNIYPMIKYSLLLCFFIFNLSCNRFEDFSINLPDPSELIPGEQIIWVNGEEIEFGTEDNILFFESSNIISYAVEREYSNLSNGRTIFSFRRISLIEREFKLINGNEERAERNDDLIAVSVGSGAGADSDVAEYKYVSSKNELFELTFVDLENRTVAGKFKANFKMTRSRGFQENEIGLPEFIALEGVFHDQY